MFPSVNLGTLVDPNLALALILFLMHSSQTMTAGKLAQRLSDLESLIHQAHALVDPSQPQA